MSSFIINPYRFAADNSVYAAVLGSDGVYFYDVTDVASGSGSIGSPVASLVYATDSYNLYSPIEGVYSDGVLYVLSAGDSYVYIISIDVSDPTNPSILDEATSYESTSAACSMVLHHSGDYLFIKFASQRRLYSLDITNPSSLSLTEYNYNASYFGAQGGMGWDEPNNTLYVAAYATYRVPISDPADLSSLSPTAAGSVIYATAFRERYAIGYASANRVVQYPTSGTSYTNMYADARIPYYNPIYLRHMARLGDYLYFPGHGTYDAFVRVDLVGSDEGYTTGLLDGYYTPRSADEVGGSSSTILCLTDSSGVNGYLSAIDVSTPSSPSAIAARDITTYDSVSDPRDVIVVSGA